VSSPRATLSAPRSTARSGFSLVLTLTVMAMLTLTVITAAAFITVESRLATQHHLATRARLNGLAAVRLALAHLQQEAGPDQRATARADFTVTHTQPGRNWTGVRNAMWTGVWRNDAPLQPPAWLISGRHDRTAGAQSSSLASSFDPRQPVSAANPAPDYPEAVWLPWQNDYTPPTTVLVTLVGAATAQGPVDAVPAIIKAAPETPGRPDGRVSLPKIALPDQARGAYAYWIGDEGVKIRVDARDPRAAGEDRARRLAVKGAGGVALGLLPGFTDHDGAALDPRIRRLTDFAMAPPGGLALPTEAAARGLWTDATVASEGVLADALWGGLQVDLSTLFEKPLDAFRLTEYGGGPGASTYVYSPWDQKTGSGPTDASAVFADARALLRCREEGTANDRLVAPIYSLPDRARPTARLRGPLWEALRAHHLLYRELSDRPGRAPSLDARAHFPNTVALAGLINASTAHYGHLYNRMDTTEDVWATDTLRGTPAPRPLKPGVFPYVARQQLVLGLQDAGGELRLVLTPITVLHNPYNVALRLNPVNSGDAAMRLSFRHWNHWKLDFTASSETSTTSWWHDLLTMASRTGGNPNQAESMRVYIPPLTLEPGELRVFSLPGPQPMRFDRLGTTVPRFDFRGGFYVPCLTPGGGPLNRNGTDTLSVRFRSEGPFYVRHMISCWPGDRLDETGNAGDASLYNAASEVTELLSNDLGAGRSGSAPAKLIPPGAVLPSPGQPPAVLAVLDYAVRWPGDALPFPLFTRSNPTAAMTRPEATGWSPGGMPAGHATTSSSFRMTIRAANDWSEVLETDGSGGKAFGGLSASSAGQHGAVFTSVPLAAPVSLAEYAHANIHLRDQDPLLVAGNSFASPFIPRHRVWNYRSGQNNTDLDRSYLINAALFDRHFLSGAAPTWADGREATPLTQVLDDFAAGRTRLGNVRLRPLPATDTAARLRSHRTFATAVMSEGAFNVNSVSPNAWAALLGATKGLPSGLATGDRDARYPRANRLDAVPAAVRAAPSGEAAWNGLRSLDDRQLRLLAQGIVDEIRWRTIYPHRNENYVSPNHDSPRSYRGATATTRVNVPAPFQGLAQFVNRYLCNTFAFIGHGGCLQNGIHRAQAAGAALAPAAGPGTPLSAEGAQAPNQGPGQTPWTDPTCRVNLRGGEASGPGIGTATMAEGAPGALLQSDVLEAIGPALAARSDTFVIRVYAEAASADGVAGAWFEATAQRRPEFMDARQAAETPVTHPTDSRLKNPALRPVNRMLGRRFHLTDFRGLRAEQL
jgi:hypothetical protein